MAVKKTKPQVASKNIKSVPQPEKSLKDTKKTVLNQSKKAKKQKQDERFSSLYSLSEIEETRKSILESPKNYNKIVKLLSNLQTINSIIVDNKDVNSNLLTLSRSLIHNLYEIFSQFISQRLIKVFKGISEQEETVRKWLASKYDTFQNELYSFWSIPFFTEAIATIKIDSLETFMKLIKDEGKFLGPSLGEQYFPTLRYRYVLSKLLTAANIENIDEDNSDYVFSEFKDNYFEKYWDLKFYFFSEFQNIINEITKSGNYHRLVFNKLVTLTKSSPVYDIENKDQIVELPLWVEQAPQNTMYSINNFRLNFEKSWIGALNLKGLTKLEYSSALSILHKRIIPFFSEAQKLMDFLTASYTLGIQTKDILLSILALNGLWELMKSYNLDYPNFYTNLYAILTPDLLHLKEKSRFFRLLDLFMSSTHLSASIVASFIKRLARLSLTAPPSGIVCVIPFLYNLIRKHGHTTCMLLIHSTTSSEEDAVYEDPFDENETDPSKTEAIGSSIWELEAMSNHYHPNVSALVKIFSQQFTKYSYNMEDFLDWSYTKLLDAEMAKRFKGDLGVEFEKWSSMFDEEGYMSEYLY
ncbi:hypothetical protein C6P40_002029 [Pichia californica]|uniref:CCAAT-binding factor domain-containing protein n=1 Tax=Pichia californica TaxID=460514 RepID=A0A9P6WP39_9ASCO|nr:hypothetical protein C6P42_004848 [[Candida] californica]KAG0690666.1 hypothetical protein C6P40_002029 [[Candida] californica]